jgi:two-component system, chemotaxis family, response regulator Rcp1
MPQASPTFELLLVEDNPGDVYLTREAFRESRIPLRLNVVSDGEEALLYLRREAPFPHAARPDLVLLDLNLPKKDGRELLAELKADPDLRQIPVIILTTSESSQDVRRAYKLHANCYLTKPFEADAFMNKIRSIEDFWLTIARLPS